MGVSISWNGAQPDAGLRSRALEAARSLATDMEWGITPIDLDPRGHARLGTRNIENPRLHGLALVPHFACEPVHVVFLEGDGDLVDAYVQREGEGRLSLSAEPLAKTQFAGAAAHEEICDLLRMLADDFVPGLRVDDETGFYDDRDRERLEVSMEAAWKAIAGWVRESDFEPGEAFEVAGLRLRGEPPLAGVPDPYARIATDRRGLLEQFSTYFLTLYGGFGLDLDGSAATLDNLDLVLRDLDAEGWSEARENAETENLVYGLGSYFGKLVVRELGGAWEEDPDEGLRLFDVGGIGLLINPFQVATDRLVHGPPDYFAHHYRLYQELVRHLG